MYVCMYVGVCLCYPGRGLAIGQIICARSLKT